MAATAGACACARGWRRRRTTLTTSPTCLCYARRRFGWRLAALPVAKGGARRGSVPSLSRSKGSGSSSTSRLRRCTSRACLRAVGCARCHRRVHRRRRARCRAARSQGCRARRRRSDRASEVAAGWAKALATRAVRVPHRQPPRRTQSPRPRQRLRSCALLGSARKVPIPRRCLQRRPLAPLPTRQWPQVARCHHLRQSLGRCSLLSTP